MLQKPSIKLRDLKELQCSQKQKAENDEFITPFKVKKHRKPRSTPTKAKKPSLVVVDEQHPVDTATNTVVAVPFTPKSAPKRNGKSARKEPLPGQLRIHSFFKTCEKSYKIEPIKEEPPTPISKKSATEVKAKGKRSTTSAAKNGTSLPKRPRKVGRKRLFVDETSESEDESPVSNKDTGDAEWTPIVRQQPLPETSACITIVSDSDEEKFPNEKHVRTDDVGKKKAVQHKKSASMEKETKNKATSTLNETTSNTIPKKSTLTGNSPTTTSFPSTDIFDKGNVIPAANLSTPHASSVSVTNSKTPATTKRKSKTSPPRKIFEDTTSIEILDMETVKTVATPCAASSSVANSNTQSTTKRQPKPCTPSKTVEGITSNGIFDKGTAEPLANLATPQHASSSSVTNSKTPATTKRKPKPCPPYKIVEGTTFAVDAFQYGCIPGVTHYFLTHFHADHYVGLTKKFAMPLYMSSITARLVRTFIPIDEQYIHELELHTTITVDNVEITALDANHCPGAIMLLFKFLDKKCTLHTGDFRAWHGMESEPEFWNNDIHTIYLDTTYISVKSAFCTQYESIDKAKDLIDKFREKNAHSRILYVCGSYVIGKEKFWSAIANEYEMKVWTESNRSKALKSIDDKELNKLLVDDPRNSDMHVIAMAKMTYLSLVDYFSFYQHEYDILLALRPSGWEKDSKPQYRGKINIIGVEYSEHSSCKEMQRFVTFLKPEKVISTVPTGRDLMKTAVVPEKWYKYDKLKKSSNYQPGIDQFLGKTPQKKSAIRLPNERRGGLEMFVSPLKKKTSGNLPETNNNFDEDAIVSIKSTERDFELSLPGHRNPFVIQANQSVCQEIKNNTNKTKDKTVVKQEFNVDKRNSKKNNNILKATTRRVTKQIKKEPKSPDNKTDVIISQTLNDGDSCSIFIPNTLGVNSVSRANSSDFFESPSFIKKNGCAKEKIGAGVNQQVSRTNSSEYFEPTTSKSRNLRLNDSCTSGEEIPVPQKRNTCQTSKQTKAPSVASTMDEDDLEFQIQLLKKIQTQTPTPKCLKGKHQGNSTPIKVSQTNPLLKSTTTSFDSSTNEDVTPPESYMDFEKPPKVTSNKNCSQNEQIPASQTTNDLENTPRPLRNRIKNAFREIPLSQNEQISASQTTNDLANTPRPLRNKMKLAYLWKQHETITQPDVIPPSQTSIDLENTPRPLRNKRINPNSCSSLATTSHKRSKKRTVGFTAPQSFTQTRALSQILEVGEPIDIYNLSQSIKLVTEVFAKQEPDKSLDHIPRELLSSSDLDSKENEDVISVDETEDDATSQMQGSVLTQQHCKQDVGQMPSEGEDNVYANKTSQMLAKVTEPCAQKHSPLHSSVSQDSENDDFNQIYNTPKLVDFVIDAMSQQQPDKSVDHIPPELLSPTDADDDWLF